MEGSSRLPASLLGLLALLGMAVAGCASSSGPAAAGVQKIKHVIIIVQENRSFDSYFGTYPGADGIPMRNGLPTVCIPDPSTFRCLKPFHDASDLNYGAPHSPRTSAPT